MRGIKEVKQLKNKASKQLKSKELKKKNALPWFYKRTAKQRRERYKQLREKGYSSKVSYRVRDWRPSKIKRILKKFNKYL